MNSRNNEFIEYIKELLEPFEISKFRFMFGGVGIYKNDMMIALIADNELYFKADDHAAKIFESYGSIPFEYESKGKTYKMSYWKIPPEILEDPDILEELAVLAYSAALNSKIRAKHKSS